MTTLSRRGPHAVFRLFFLLSFLIQSLGFPVEAVARVIPTITLPKKSLTVTYWCEACANGGISPATGANTVVSPVTGANTPSSPARTGFAAFRSPALPLSLKHNSQNTGPSIWGAGWWSDLDQTLEAKADGSVLWRDGAGAQKSYALASSTGTPIYFSPINTYTTLSVQEVDDRNTPTLATLREKNGTTMRYRRGATAFLYPDRLTDRNGNTIDYERDASGRLLSATDVHGRALSFSYDAFGRVSRVEDSAGGQTTFSYDGSGQKLSETGPEGTVSYLYDAGHRITRITYPNGAEKIYEYDGQGRTILASDENDNNKKFYQYFSSNTVVTDALGHQTVYHSTGSGGLSRINRIIDAEGGETRFEYDLNFNMTKRIDPAGRATIFTYDAQGNATSIIDPAGRTTALTFNSQFNQATSVVDPRGKTTSLGYDAHGNLTQVQDAGGQLTQMSYDAGGHVTSSQDPLGKVTSFNYDDGDLTSVTDPLNRTTNMVRDAYSRVTQNTDPKGKATHFEYDAAGNLTKVVDAIGGQTRYTYGAGRDGKLLASVTDAKNHVTSFTYDPQGRMTSVTNALNQTKTFTYDKKGNLTSTHDAKGQTITYAYDGLDRLVTKTTPEGAMTYEYDPVGNLTKVIHYNGSVIETSYDVSNRVTQTKQTIPGLAQTFIIGYGYDNNGNRTSMTTPWGSFSYVYDDLNRLTRITNPQGQIFDFAYDALGRRKELAYPNGVTAFYNYDAAGQLLELSHRRLADSTTVAFAAYVYDAAGNRTQMTDPAGAHAYGYDNLHRLTSATHPAGSSVTIENETFAYDGVGNRTSDAAATGYVYDAANRLQENSLYEFTHDANGNLTSATGKLSNQTTTYSYDSENKLTSVELPSGVTVSFKYDGQGRRIEKSSGTLVSQITRYIYDNEDILSTFDGAGNQVVLITHGPGIDEPLFIRRTNLPSLVVHADALGSIRAYTSSTTATSVIERIEYDAFGTPAFMSGGTLANESLTGTGYAFTGREWDSEIGLHFYRERYLSKSGGFLSEDPAYSPIDGAERGSSSNFQYSYNNPLKFTDPSGLRVGDWWDLPANLGRAYDIGMDELRKDSSSHNNLGDAVRHSEWMRRTTLETNSVTAWLAGVGHEIEGVWYGQSWQETVMDLHNNRIGRRAGISNTAIDQRQLWTLPLNRYESNPYSDFWCDL
jgi:RHS repeat-associated protein